MNDNVKQMVYCALLASIVAILAQIKIDLVGIVAGPTGGYIFSFPIMAFAISYLLTIKKETIYKIFAMSIGTVICYIIGTGWFMYSTQNTLWVSLTWCVFPFLIGDIIKIVVATFFSNRIKQG